MAASVCQPVVVPGHYDPMFKVDVLLHTPIREKLGSLPDLKVDVMVLSLQLDTLCKQELNAQPSHRIENGKTGKPFSEKANIVHSNLQQVLSKSHHSTPPEMFLQESGLDKLFPRVAAYISQPNTVSMSLKKTSIDDYFKQLSHLQYILAMARQINNDVSYPLQPKYLAHQLAVLYQAINSIPSGGKTLSRHKANIEENFKALKNCISEIAEDENADLPNEVRDWLLELTDSIVQVISSMPSAMTAEILPLSRTLQH